MGKPYEINRYPECSGEEKEIWKSFYISPSLYFYLPQNNTILSLSLTIILFLSLSLSLFLSLAIILFLSVSLSSL